MKPGTRVRHKSLGIGTVEPYIDFDGTKERSTMLESVGEIYIKLDSPPENWATIVCVDIEALEVLDGHND